MLRHCATSRKVAGSIPYGIIGSFIDLILPVALWPWVDSARGTRVSTGGLRRPMLRADNIFVLKPDSFNLLEPSGPV